MKSEAELALILSARNLAGREVDNLGKSLDGVDGKARKAGRSLGDFGKIMAVGVVGAAVAVGAALVGATLKAAQEEKSVAKLTAALKANDKAFSGNMKAVQGAEDAAAKLAFADDDVRDSLAFLVTQTKDTDAALRLQATAMDIARLKGVGLLEASQMLTKGMSGSSKILTQLGVVDLPKTATETERLAAIQTAAAGQAKAYGDTAAGAQESFQIAVDNLVEDLGATFLPILKDVMVFLRDSVLPAIRHVIGAVKDWMTENKPLVDAIKSFVGTVLSAFVAILGAVFTALGNIAKWITSNKSLMDGFKGFWRDVTRNVEAFVAGLKWIINNIGKIMSAVNRVNENPNSPAYHYLHAPGSAAGGMVGMQGPELRWVGENGPEYVVPNHRLGSMGGVTIRGVSERDILDMVDRGLYFRFTTAASGVRS